MHTKNIVLFTINAFYRITSLALQRHFGDGLQDGKASFSLQLIHPVTIHHHGGETVGQHDRRGGGFDRNLRALGQVQQPEGFHLQGAGRGITVHQQLVDVVVVVVEVGVDAALGGVKALGGDVGAGAQAVRADVLGQRAHQQLRQLRVGRGDLRQTIGLFLLRGVDVIGIVVDEGIGVAADVSGTVRRDHHGAWESVQSKAATGSESISK